MKYGDILEDWLEWHKRCVRDAREVAVLCKVWVEHVLQDRMEDWAGHIAGMGRKSNSPHALKFLVGWRPLEWWRTQQIYYLTGCQTIFHPPGWSKPRRWEDGLPSKWWTEN